MSVLAVRRHFLSIALVLHSAAAMADTSDTSQTTELTQRVDACFGLRRRQPWRALGVIRNGELVYKKGYGNASLEFGVPIDPENTAFAIGSISKQFTAAAILLLVQDGKISLTDDIRQYHLKCPITVKQFQLTTCCRIPTACGTIRY
jgi:CubicO group peptidase (beta-lactamase class C family)